jgi:hypothetical protein
VQMDDGRRFLSKPCKRNPQPPPPRVSPLERIRAEMDDPFGSEWELGEVLEEVARLGVPLLMQEGDRGGGRRVPGPCALQPRRARPGRQRERAVADHGQDHSRAGRRNPSSTLRHIPMMSSV